MLTGLLVLISLSLHALPDFDREQIQQRISPVGNVHLDETGQSTKAAASTEKPVEEKKAPGQATFEQYCSVCHRDGVAGAPKFHDSNDWKPRLAKQNIDSLTASAMKGLNAMPAKGTCQECSEADIKAAIEYMVPPS
jgi:cytochrome c5